jgi:prepilin-type N-terminal cleavage/methylation domain-containing protein
MDSKNRTTHKHKAICTDHRGFSLLELLVSIVILVLIMVPLMSNFFRSIKINKEAEELQDYSNLAANVMEGVKYLDLDQIQLKLSSITNFDILFDAEGNTNAEEVIRLQKNPDGTYRSYGGAVGEQDTYYYGINKIKEGTLYYDALITVDALPYKNYDPANQVLMNNYPMPNLASLNEDRNGLLLSSWYRNNDTGELKKAYDGNANTKTLDDTVLEEFLLLGESHAEEEWQASDSYKGFQNNILEWQQKHQDELIKQSIDPTVTLTPEPVSPGRPVEYDNRYCNAANVSSYITKTMKITLNSIGSNTNLQYKLEYQCDWPSGATYDKDVIAYSVQDKNYGTTVSQVYLFYNPLSFIAGDASDNSDNTIVIENNSSVQPVNFYVVNQANTTFNPKLNIQSSTSDTLKIFTNLHNDEVALNGITSISNGIVESNLKNRIYSIAVQLYAHQDGPTENKYRELIYELQSNKNE